jgi:hypothetical protein
MKTYWRSGGIAPRILNLGARWRWVVSFTLRPRERTPGTHWTGGWMGLRASLDAIAKRKIPSPWTPVVQPVAKRCTGWAIRLPKRTLFVPERCVVIFQVVNPKIVETGINIREYFKKCIRNQCHGGEVRCICDFLVKRKPNFQATE